MSETSTESRRLWFDAKNGLVDCLYRLYSEGRAGRTWVTGYAAYRKIAMARDGMGTYLYHLNIEQQDAELFGMKVIIDRTLPDDTIELRDTQDCIIGKVYNIG